MLSSSCQLHNADEFLALLRDYPQVKGLVAGHTHNEIESKYEHLRIMTTPSTMVQVTHDQKEGFRSNSEFWDYHQADTTRHGYRVLDLQADGQFKTEVRWVKCMSISYSGLIVPEAVFQSVHQFVCSGVNWSNNGL